MRTWVLLFVAIAALAWAAPAHPDEDDEQGPLHRTRIDDRSRLVYRDEEEYRIRFLVPLPAGWGARLPEAGETVPWYVVATESTRSVRIEFRRLEGIEEDEDPIRARERLAGEILGGVDRAEPEERDLLFHQGRLAEDERPRFFQTRERSAVLSLWSEGRATYNQVWLVPRTVRVYEGSTRVSRRYVYVFWIRVPAEVADRKGDSIDDRSFRQEIEDLLDSIEFLG